MRLVFIVTLCFWGLSIVAQQPLELKLQQRGEVVVSIDAEDLHKLPNQGSWSIDKVKNERAIIYLNQNYYDELLRLNIPFIQEPTPSQVTNIKMAQSVLQMANWDAYPDYETYLNMMNQFASDYPEICKLDTIGYSEEDRVLLAVKISDNVNEDETEPEFLYTSSMHGDELTGYVLMLRLIDYLLVNYDNEDVKKLVDGIEIYINPLANPDGTFAGGNETVQGATRANANGVDINRNFPDRIVGNYPNGSWQKETIAMMEYMRNRNFGMSMNFHGGAEVMNYPYDDTVYRGELHPDNNWFDFICTNYITEARKVDDFYMRDVDADGVTVGYVWYAVSGGRQDYVTCFLNGREVTAELSGVKLVDSSTLPSYWDKNYKGLLGYLEQALYGLQGKVTNANEQPVHAKIQVLNHDVDSSHVWSQNSGTYYRYLNAGNYTIKVSALGYKSQTFTDVSISDFETTVLNVQLEEGVGIIRNEILEAQIYPNPNFGSFTVTLPNTLKASNLSVYTLDGKLVWFSEQSFIGNLSINLKELNRGVYFFTANAGSKVAIQKLIIQ